MAKEAVVGKDGADLALEVNGRERGGRTGCRIGCSEDSRY